MKCVEIYRSQRLPSDGVGSQRLQKGMLSPMQKCRLQCHRSSSSSHSSPLLQHSFHDSPQLLRSVLLYFLTLVPAPLVMVMWFDLHPPTLHPTGKWAELAISSDQLHSSSSCPTQATKSNTMVSFMAWKKLLSWRIRCNVEPRIELIMEVVSSRKWICSSLTNMQLPYLGLTKPYSWVRNRSLEWRATAEVLLRVE